MWGVASKPSAAKRSSAASRIRSRASPLPTTSPSLDEVSAFGEPFRGLREPSRTRARALPGPSGWAACGRSDDPMRGCHDRLTPCLGFHARACGCCPEGSMVHFGVETGTCASTPRAAARCRGVPSESHRTDRCGNKPRSQFTPGGGCAEYSLAKAVDPVEALLIDVPQRPLPEHGLDVQQNVDVHEAPSHWILR